MAWKFKPAIPIYYQIVEEITARIFDGRYPPGGKIPSVREIAEEASVNPNTVQRAFSELESSGLIVTQRTAGRVVTSNELVIAQARGAVAEKSVAEFIDGMRSKGLSIDDLIAILNTMKERTCDAK